MTVLYPVDGGFNVTDEHNHWSVGRMCVMMFEVYNPREAKYNPYLYQSFPGCLLSVLCKWSLLFFTAVDVKFFDSQY